MGTILHSLRSKPISGSEKFQSIQWLTLPFPAPSVCSALVTCTLETGAGLEGSAAAGSLVAGGLGGLQLMGCVLFQ